MTSIHWWSFQLSTFVLQLLPISDLKTEFVVMDVSVNKVLTCICSSGIFLLLSFLSSGNDRSGFCVGQLFWPWVLYEFPFPFSFPQVLFLSFSEIFPVGFASFLFLAFQSLDRDFLLPGVLIITSSVPSHGPLMEACTLGFIQEFSFCCSRDSRKISHNWYWSKNNK